jgi:hypothetical protein
MGFGKWVKTVVAGDRMCAGGCGRIEAACICGTAKHARNVTSRTQVVRGGKVVGKGPTGTGKGKRR